MDICVDVLLSLCVHLVVMHSRICCYCMFEVYDAIQLYRPVRNMSSWASSPEIAGLGHSTGDAMDVADHGE